MWTSLRVFGACVGLSFVMGTQATALSVSVQGSAPAQDTEFEILKNVLISEDGRGDIFFRELKWPASVDLKQALEKTWQKDCDGQSIKYSASNVVFTADSDGLLADQDAEAVYIQAMSGDLTVGDACISVRTIDISQLSVETLMGQMGRIQHARYERLTDDQSLLIKGVDFEDSASRSVLNMGSLDVRVSDDWGDAELSIVGLTFSPATFLYPDMVKRLSIPDDISDMNVNADIRKTAQRLDASIQSRHILNFEMTAEVKNLNVPLTSVIDSAEISFRDEGLFSMYKGFMGESLPDTVRSGNFPGLPSIAKTEKFEGLRNGVADWLAKGEGYAKIDPEAPVAMPAVLTTLMLSPARLANLLNITTHKENP